LKVDYSTRVPRKAICRPASWNATGTARFASHADIAARTLAVIPDAVRDEIAAFDNEQIHDIAGAWVKHDQATRTDTDVYETYIGEMLKNTLIALRDAGEFAELPLAGTCVMWVGGTHANFCWPEIESLAPDGRVN
jgi:hypothetical protein